MKSWVCFVLGALLAGLGLLIVPEGIRDFGRLAGLSKANVQVPAEVVRVERLRVPIDPTSAGVGPHEDVEDATLRYGVGGTTYTCVARLHLPIGETKPGARLGVHYVESDPARCYLPNAVAGSRVMSLLLPVLLIAAGAAVFWFGLLFRAQVPAGR